KSSELLGALFLMQDISDMKELDRLKSEFVMIISHELKTPLTSINMSIDLLRESLGKTLQPKDNELLDVAKEDVVRLRMLVSDLLDLSKIEAGKIELQFTQVNILSLMQTVVQNFQTQLNNKQIMISINNDHPSLPLVYGDEDKLLWVFSNLISNAIKAVKTAGKITLRADQNGDFILVSVKDNGKGIPLNLQKRIFEKFVQLSGDDNSSGTGLGLMICREIIRAHGGTIWVDSELGKGADFCFTVPVSGENSKSLFSANGNNE
ncbi:MAG TPA: HAMP domain-containing sensor histidine kinase, partial [Candidatus Cloacimonadota bacterium]|nr:HAMP domain-containing sensor histidine kinase [Candidatus Cloacimonadota bacterium]